MIALPYVIQECKSCSSKIAFNLTLQYICLRNTDADFCFSRPNQLHIVAMNCLCVQFLIAI